MAVTQDDLRTLLDYHYWARDRLLDALDPLTPEQFARDLGSSFRSIRETLVHVYAAEWAWWSRWQGRSPASMLAADEFPDVASVREAWRRLERDVRAFLDQLGPDGIDQRISYRLLNGTEGASIFSHMLQHVVNHASYHRGQITTMLRQVGAAPPKGMDLIAYHRTREHHQARA